MRDSRIDWVMKTAKQVQKAYEGEFGSVKARHLSPEALATFTLAAVIHDEGYGMCEAVEG